jgi:hypothetical protein
MSSGGAEQFNLPWPIKAVIQATNKGDSKAFVDAFARESAVNDWGQVHAGKGEIGAWDKRSNSGTGRQLRVTGVSKLGDETLVLLEITSADGETKESGTFSFQLRGDRVGMLEIG